MVNPIQYPHTVKILYKSEAVKAPNGGIIPGQDTNYVGSGRLEVDKKSAFKDSESGTRIALSGTIYMPKGVERFPLGAKVEVYELAVLIATGTIQNFEKSLLNRKVWL